jgi:putative oxidoreductase
VVAGVLLLSGLFVPLALTLLAPVLVNITAFHIFLAPGNYGLVALILAAELFVAWSYRTAFAPLLGRAARTPRSAPGFPRELRQAA